MALTLRRKRWLLRAASAALLVAAGWFFVDAAWRGPAPEPEVTLASAGDGDGAGVEPPPRRLDGDRPLWARRLRRPLYDPPPPPAPVVEKKPPPPIRAKLLGTIIEPGASKAMIGDGRGSVEFRAEGDRLSQLDGDATIVEIGPDSVKVARGDEREITVLKIESPY